VRLLAWFAIAAQALFIAGWIVAGVLEPGYSPVHMYVSELGRRAAAHPWIFDLSTTVWGLGFIALGVALRPALEGHPWRRVAPSLFVLAGLFAIALAPLRLDCATSANQLCHMRDAAGALSWRHYGHEWSSLALQVALLLTPLALARTLWPARLARLLLAGGLAVALLWSLAFLLSDSRGTDGGLWQRIWLLPVHGWVLLCAAALILAARPASVQRRHQDHRHKNQLH
jgi:hypothetical protein